MLWRNLTMLAQNNIAKLLSYKYTARFTTWTCGVNVANGLIECPNYNKYKLKTSFFYINDWSGFKFGHEGLMLFSNQHFDAIEPHIKELEVFTPNIHQGHFISGHLDLPWWPSQILLKFGWNDPFCNRNEPWKFQLHIIIHLESIHHWILNNFPALRWSLSR